jgi:hypothetical protein
MDAVAPGQLLRGEQQVRNLKHTFKSKFDDADELFTVMQSCKSGDCYVRAVKAALDPAILIASDQQLNDMVRFRATFCFGAFECIPTTYRHSLMITQRNQTSPIFLGPMLTHYCKNFPSFYFFHLHLLNLGKN